MTRNSPVNNSSFPMKDDSGIKKWYVFDLETDNLYDKVTKIHCLVLHDINRDQTFTYGPDRIADGLEHLATANVLIGHNILFYDIPVIRKLYPFYTFAAARIIDTLICTRLIWPKEKLYETDEEQYTQVPAKLRGSASLKAWGYRLSDYKIEFKDFTEYSEAMAEYCRQDVSVTTKLFQHIQKQSCSEPALKLEHDFALAIEKQIRSGFPFDVDACLDLVDDLRAKQTELEGSLKKLFPPKRIETIFVPKVNNASRGYVKGEPFVKVTHEEFNPGSRQQIVERLKDKYNWTPGKTTEKGNPILDDDILSALPYPEAKPLAEYMLIKKRLGQIADGNNAWLKLVNNDTGCIHGDVITNGCITGRCSHCIEENQLVTQPKGMVPIKDVKPGDYVYSYDKNLKLQLNKVIEVIDQGVQECYELKWKTNFNSKSGSFICTANHKIFTQNGWKRLAEISRGDKINHMSITVTEGRKVLNVLKGKSIRQCTFIKNNLFKKPGKDWHIHHIDRNKLNDDIENLQLVTASEHTKLHLNEDEYNVKHFTKFQLLRMLAKAKGHPTRVPMDFDTFKKKCVENNISIPMVVARYSKVTEKYITKRDLSIIMENNWSLYRIGIEYKISGRAKRVDDLFDSHGVIKNYWVVDIVYVGLRQTYDLNVENDHNFICQELCVSNSHPNMSQVPAGYSPYGKECRSLFHAPDGWTLIGVDAKALELRCLAGYLAYWDDGEYARVVTDESIDIHVYNQEMFGVETRDIAKRLLYGIAYGCGALKAGTIIDPNEKDEVVLRKLGSNAINSFMQGIPALKKLKDKIANNIAARGYLIGLDGRPLFCRSDFKGLNVLLQSSGALLMKQVVINLHQMMYDRGYIYGQDWQQHGMIHDECQVSCPPAMVDTLTSVALEAFPAAQQFFEFRCPIEGDAHVGYSWDQTH
jgi:hypothetical protein